MSRWMSPGAVALLAVLPSCSSIFKNCTLADCNNQIRVRLTKTELLGDVKTIRACWNNKCFTENVDLFDGSGDPAITGVSYNRTDYSVNIGTRDDDGLRPTDVLALTLTAGSGKVLIDWSGPLGNVRKHYPNGEGCDGECLVAELSAP